MSGPDHGAEARVLRDRIGAHAAAVAALGRPAAREPGPIAVRVYDAGHLPTAVPAYFACHPLTVGGKEVEGGAAAIAADTARTVYVLMSGSAVPKVGDNVVAWPVAGARWVAQAGGAAPTCPVVIGINVKGCGLAANPWLGGATFAVTLGKKVYTATTNAAGYAEVDAQVAGNPPFPFTWTLTHPRYTDSFSGSGSVGCNAPIVLSLPPPPTNPGAGRQPYQFQTPAPGYVCSLACAQPLPRVLHFTSDVADATFTYDPARAWWSAAIDVPAVGGTRNSCTLGSFCSDDAGGAATTLHATFGVSVDAEYYYCSESGNGKRHAIAAGASATDTEACGQQHLTLAGSTTCYPAFLLAGTLTDPLGLTPFHNTPFTLSE